MVLLPSHYLYNMGYLAIRQELGEGDFSPVLAFHDVAAIIR